VQQQQHHYRQQGLEALQAVRQPQVLLLHHEPDTGPGSAQEPGTGLCLDPEPGIGLSTNDALHIGSPELQQLSGTGLLHH
jgi:hypothetical protein